MHRAHSIQVLTLTAGGIARMTWFQEPSLFPAFELPLSVRPVEVPAALTAGPA